MKFRFPYLLILFPLHSFSQLDSLKGNVKSVKESIRYAEKAGLTIYHRELDFGQYSLNDETIFKEFKKGLLPRLLLAPTQKEFDTKGRLIQLTFFTNNNDSFFTSNWKYIYDENNNLIQEKLEFSNGDYQITNYRYKPFKDSIARIMTEVSYSNDPDWFNMKQYFYRNTAQLIEVRELSGFGWDRKVNYKYDDSGRLIAEINSDVKRVLKYDSIMKTEIFQDSAADYYQETFNYYDDGSLREKISGCSPNLIAGACQRTLYIYDDKRRKAKTYYYWRGTDSLFSHREYEYYTDNSLKKISWFYKDEPISRNFAEYFYKNKELIKAVLNTADNTTVIEFEYKVDSHNNWIEQKKFVNKNLFYTRKREIIYRD